MRLAAQSIKFEKGVVHLPSQAPWLEEYIRELTGFPGTKYDDQVDSTSQALELLGNFLFPEFYVPLQLPTFGYARPWRGLPWP